MSREAKVRLLAVLAFGGWCGGALAAGHLGATTTYLDHAVTGTTAAAIYRELTLHPIIDPDDGPAFANITHEHTLGIATAPVDGACRVASVDFQWRFVITLPMAAEAAQLDRRTRSAWLSFVARLKWHEERHRAIFLDCGQRFVTVAAKMSGPCRGLDRLVRDYVEAQYAACMDRQGAFDRADRPAVLASPFLALARAGSGTSR